MFTEEKRDSLKVVVLFAQAYDKTSSRLEDIAGENPAP